jgi:hypothetical protein
MADRMPFIIWVYYRKNGFDSQSDFLDIRRCKSKG